MAPLFTLTLLAGSLMPQSDYWRQTRSELDELATNIMPILPASLAVDFEQPPVIYFDAPPRSYGGAIRR